MIIESIAMQISHTQMGSRCDVSDTGGAVLEIVRGENVHQNVECSNNISDKLIGF